MALSKVELENLMTELKPHVETQDKKLATGLAAYTALFKAHPEYISHFSRLQGLDASNVMKSEGIKHYATTLVEAVVKMLDEAADKNKLDAVTKKYGQDHVTRQVTKTEFMNGLPIFISVFQGLVSEPKNKESLKKFLDYIFKEMCIEIKA
ncbi:unnamed protein product [Calicophoron daubneyi]|uniref:Globin domain-containing protein n=1 Tax=Calicophoron daubneyi TaxID=300641 RepID=A0AAV2TGM2_CALDB